MMYIEVNVKLYKPINKISIDFVITPENETGGSTETS